MGWKSFKVVGVTHKDNPGDTMTRLDKISRYCHHGSKFSLVREPENEFDGNAIAVRQFFKGGGSVRLGYIAKALAVELAPKIDAGWEPNVKFGMKFINDEGECHGLQLRYEEVE
jgi:hypothetical protein